MHLALTSSSNAAVQSVCTASCSISAPYKLPHQMLSHAGWTLWGCCRHSWCCEHGTAPEVSLALLFQITFSFIFWCTLPESLKKCEKAFEIKNKNPTVFLWSKKQKSTADLKITREKCRLFIQLIVSLCCKAEFWQWPPFVSLVMSLGGERYTPLALWLRSTVCFPPFHSTICSAVTFHKLLLMMMRRLVSQCGDDECKDSLKGH